MAGEYREALIADRAKRLGYGSGGAADKVGSGRPAGRLAAGGTGALAGEGRRGGGRVAKRGLRAHVDACALRGWSLH